MSNKQRKELNVTTFELNGTTFELNVTTFCVKADIASGKIRSSYSHLTNASRLSRQSNWRNAKTIDVSPQWMQNDRCVTSVDAKNEHCVH